MHSGCYGLCVPGPRRDPDIPDLWLVSKVADELDVSRTEVRRLIQSGRLTGLQAENLTGDGTWVLRPEVVAAYKAKREAKRENRG